MTRGRDDAERDFIGRWSRLKRERASVPEGADPTSDPTPAASPPAPEPEPESATAPAKSDAEILAELGLPDPETLTADDDFTAFMAKAVPEHLRRVALRRLWVSKPVFAVNDGLIDYADDYTDAAVAVTKLSTGYTVGRGFMTEDEVRPPRGHPEHEPPTPEVRPAPEEAADAAEPAETQGAPAEMAPYSASGAESAEPEPAPRTTAETSPNAESADSQDAVPQAVGRLESKVGPKRYAKSRINFRLTDS